MIFDKNLIELLIYEKLVIYKDYFKGRRDCYVIRWEKDGKSGYVFRYLKEVRFLSKDERKKIFFKNRYDKLFDEIILKYLKG